MVKFDSQSSKSEKAVKVLQKWLRNKILIAFILNLVSNSFFPQAKLYIPDAKKNFGFIKRGELVILKFNLINKGNQPLVISDYKAECSCTKVILPKKPILPNEKNEIVVEFDTKTVYDRQDRNIQILSNDLNSPTRIRFKGVVINKEKKN